MKTLALFSLLALTASAQMVDIDVHLWSLSSEGDVDFDGDVSASVDLDDDLGLDEEWTPGATIVLGEGLFRLGASATQIDLAGSETVSRTISFGGLSFDASADADSSLELLLARGFARLHFGSDEFAVNVDAGGIYADIETTISGASGLVSETAETNVVLPFLGAEAVANPFDALELRAAIRLSQWEVSDIDVSWTDIEIGAHYEGLSPFTVGGGYRRLALDLDAPSDDLSSDLVFSGPVIYTGLEF